MLMSRQKIYFAHYIKLAYPLTRWWMTNTTVLCLVCEKAIQLFLKVTESASHQYYDLKIDQEAAGGRLHPNLTHVQIFESLVYLSCR